MEIVLSFANPIKFGKRGEFLEKQLSRIIIGQLEENAETLQNGFADYLGIRFRPEGAFIFLTVPQSEIN